MSATPFLMVGTMERDMRFEIHNKDKYFTYVDASDVEGAALKFVNSFVPTGLQKHQSLDEAAKHDKFCPHRTFFVRNVEDPFSRQEDVGIEIVLPRIERDGAIAGGDDSPYAVNTLAELLGEYADKGLEELERIDVILTVFAEGDLESQPRTYTLRWIAERYLEQWDTLTQEGRRTAIATFDNGNEARRLEREKAELCPQRGEGEFQSAWADHTMNASYWFHPQQVVSPEEAAMLMVGWNPLADLAPKTEGDASKGNGDDYSRKLLKYDEFKRRFESAEKRDSKPRTLLEWVPIAEGVGFERDAWVLEYMALTGLKGDAPAVDDNAAVVAVAMPKPAWVVQARAMGEQWMHDQENCTGKRPTVLEIAKHLEGELSTQGITGARGRFLVWETIKKEALKGITGRAKGQNFKTAMGNPQCRKRSPSVKGQ